MLAKFIAHKRGRFSLIFVLVLAFGITSSLFIPSDSTASHSKSKSVINPAHRNIDTPSIGDLICDDSVQPHDLIGELEGKDFRIQIFAAYPDPVYTIRTAADNTLLADRISAEAVALQFPSLPLLTLQTDDDEGQLPLMSDVPINTDGDDHHRDW